MIRMRPIPILFGTIFATAAVAKAGEIHVVSLSFPPDSESGNISLVSDDLEITKSSEGIWSFTLKANDTLRAAVTLEVSNAPTGYWSVKSVFDIPYYWDVSETRTLATSIVSQDVSDEGLSEFLTDIGSGPKLVQNVTLVHTRAALFWRERLKQLGRRDRIEPNADDVRVAYWLLRTTRDLVIGQYYVPDEDSNSAASWLKGVIAKEKYGRRLFNSSTASAKDCDDIIKTIEARTSYFYSRVIQHLEADFGAAPGLACMRINKLDKFASQLEGDDLIDFDGEFGNSVKIRAAAVVCSTRAVIAANSVSGAKATDLASATIKAADDTLNGSQAARFPDLKRSLQLRTSELKKVAQ